MKKTLLATVIIGTVFLTSAQNSNCEDSLTTLKKRVTYLEQRSPEYKADYVDKKSTFELQYLDSKFISSDKFIVNLLIKNTGNDKLIYILPENLVLIDGEGNGYNCTNIKLGNSVIKINSYWGNCITNTLYSNVPTKLTLTFDVTKDLDFISICVVELILEKKIDASKIVLKLRNIQTKKE